MSTNILSPLSSLIQSSRAGTETKGCIIQSRSGSPAETLYHHLGKVLHLTYITLHHLIMLCSKAPWAFLNMTQSSGRLEELQKQLAVLGDTYSTNDEDYRRQILQIEQEQENNRQEIEQLCVSKRQQEMKRDDEYPQKKRDLEARIVAERDAKVAELLQKYNEIFTRELADMASRLSSEKTQDEEIIRVAYEAFNAGATKSQAQIQALQATRCYQKTQEDDELLLLQQEIQAEQENQRRREEIENRRRAIEVKKQKIEKMIQETKEEEVILRQLQQKKAVDDGDTVTIRQGIGADNASEEQSRRNSFEKQRGKF